MMPFASSTVRLRAVAVAAMFGSAACGGAAAIPEDGDGTSSGTARKKKASYEQAGEGSGAGGVVAGDASPPEVDAGPPNTLELKCTTVSVYIDPRTDREKWSATFTFKDTANETAEFECAFEGGPFAACTSPTSRPGPIRTSPTKRENKVFDVRLKKVPSLTKSCTVLL